MRGRRIALGAACAALCALCASADLVPTYTIGVATQQEYICYSETGPIVTNAWTGGALVYSTGAITNEAVSLRDSDRLALTNTYMLAAADCCFAWKHMGCEYYMGDTLKPPADVDWYATYEAFLQTPDATSSNPTFLFNTDTANPCVYVLKGGTENFSWVLKNGTTNTVFVNAESAARGRPKRLFWTDSPYNGPTISLKDKYVKLYGPDSLLDVKTATVTNLLDGVAKEQEGTISQGVYIEPTAHVLKAAGQISGQFTIVFYDSGDYNNILCVEVISVQKPVTVTAKGVIGMPLTATGCGYDTDGLEPIVRSGIADSDDDRGDYLYKHACENAYSEKNNCVYPLRPTVGQRWKAEIFWMETDPMGVQWPFELVQYENDWPTRGYLYVRGENPENPGAKIYFPDDYEPTLCDYQDPYDHALAVAADKSFYTKGAGRSLIKLTYDDEVVFLPILSVLRTDTNYFTLASSRIPVGERFTVRGGTRAGLTEGGLSTNFFKRATSASGGLTQDAAIQALVTSDITMTLAADAAPGYIYTPASGTQYDANLYYETTNATADAISTSDSGSDAPSVIYAINEGPEDIEVWWSRRVTEHVGEGSETNVLPAWIDIPCLPQRYRPVWPEPFEAPTIVIAAEEGSANECIYPRYGAAYFDRPSAQMRLAGRQYFPNGSGTLAFWTRAAVYDDPIDGATNAPSCLMQLGNAKGEALFLRIGKNEKLQLLLNGSDDPIIDMSLPKPARANSWMHIALTIANNQDFTLYVDGTNNVATGSISAPAKFLGEYLDQCAAGLTIGTITNVLEKVISKSEEVKSVDGSQLKFVECGTWDEIKANLTAGNNVCLTNDVTQGKDTIYLDKKNAILDLNGCTWTGRDGYWVLAVRSGAQLSIIDSSEEQTGTIIGKNVAANTGGAMFHVYEAGTLTICGGTFRGSTAGNEKCRLNGGCVGVDKAGTLVMNGGTIENCSSSWCGGAVYVGGTFTMNGGVITNCTAVGDGGGVYVAQNGKMTLGGGRIDGCTAGVCGGGVYNLGTFTMSGGAIVRCTAKATAYGAGGGILAYGTTAINGGLIAYNKAPSQPCACIDAYGGTLVMHGGIVDVAPTEANYVAPGRTAYVDFTEPTYYGPSAGGLYLIGLGAAEGRQLAEIRMHAHAMTQGEIAAAMYALRDTDESDLTGYYSFRKGEDLASAYQTAKHVDTRTFIERVQNLTCYALNTVLTTPGAPARARAILESDSEPTVYVQNDPSLPGFNPNEEHAFVEARSESTYTVWALRGDLNDTTGEFKNRSSPPGVFVEYEKDGEARLQFYHVAVTNPIPYTGADWSWVKGRTLSGTATAGSILPGPHPIDTLDYDPWLAEDWWEPGTGSSRGPCYRDREGQLWARCAGTLPIYMYYAMQDGFFFPQYADDAQPEAGEAIPWLSLFGVTDVYSLRHPNDLDPARWTWDIRWPTASGVMKVGQTLYEATGGLPGVYNMKSVAVLYPDPEMDQAGKTVMLSDPTVMRSAAFDWKNLEALGLTTDPEGGLIYRKGIYYFSGLPPYISSRVYVDPSNNKLCLVGKYVQKNAGVSILYPNVLTAEDVTLLKEGIIAEEFQTASIAYSAWCNAVDALGDKPVEPNTARFGERDELQTTYTARDSYALTAVGCTNWVVLIENDATNDEMNVSAGSSINMHVFFVTNAYYTGSVVSREDENDLLSQQLSILYTETMGGLSDAFEFEWAYRSPSSDGTVPTDFDTYKTDTTRTGTHITIGGQGSSLKNMVNQYWACRYRARAGTRAYEIMGGDWSDWCGPALAEGWIQRCLNNVTPFNQLMTDLYENEVESVVSMIQKAGAPYEGDVALNQDALNDCGLIQLYETLLNAAEKISLMQRTCAADANEQLMLCAERLDDLYVLLGDEAYSDAKDPTISYGSTARLDFSDSVTPLFCFDNQVATLLDEELALLRGRTGESAPDTTTGPYYNRLLWNFTKGITEGEVAYAINYGIKATAASEDSVVITEEDAAASYPQGHGDAYGHYLSALTGWYRLLRNPYFSWVRKQGEMVLADATANVDYYEEKKFVTSALKAARTAADVTDLTGRKAWGDGESEFAGYADEKSDRAFGYGEWANRGAYGALVNWAVGNSLLPAGTSTVSEVFSDKALTKIDRSTVGELDQLGAYVTTIQQAEDRLDAGLNPLGLSDDAIPFDLAPDGAADGSDTHFEQIRARAATAVGNADTLLEKAEKSAYRLRTLAEDAASLSGQIDAAELAYKQELIGYYGRPYSDDLGPGKTYEQDYDGPDLVHYMWMDISQYGLTDVEDTYAVNTYHYGSLPLWNLGYLFTSAAGSVIDALNSGMLTNTLWFSTSASGIAVKPSNITGSRPVQGTIQDKYGEFLSAYSKLKLAQSNYEYQQDVLERTMKICTILSIKNLASYVKTTASNLKAAVVGIQKIFATKQEAKAEAKEEKTEAVEEAQEAAMSSATGVGMTVVTDPSSIAGKATAAAYTASEEKNIEKKKRAKLKQAGSVAAVILSQLAAEAKAVLEYNKEEQEQMEKIVSAATTLNDRYSEYLDAYLETVQAIEAYKTEVDKGEMVLERRELDRRTWVNQVEANRYADMFFRLTRNAALSRYTAGFDLAQKYVYETAKAYGYETATDPADSDGKDFLGSIVAARDLASLNGILAEMDANWLVLKPRLGLNNPQPYATWFSLRGECFRILPGEDGDAAWAKELTKYWVDDIQSDADFRHYCQRFQSTFGLQDKEPGLIIPFETTIDFAKNLFGNDLAGGDHAYDSTWYATRIAAAGLWFDGYNSKAAGYKGNELLANTPVAYLVPIGTDRMRAPGSEDDTFVEYNVVDQVIATPYVIGSAYLNDLSWYPTASDGDLGGADSESRIRRHPSFRAYFDTAGGEPTDAALDCTRLIGRSVWNTKWMLVIPAGSMNADREKALSVFINGSDVNRDGKLDLLPVSDIRIGFKTYSNSGN